VHKGAHRASVIDAKDVAFVQGLESHLHPDYVSAHWPLVCPHDSIADAVRAFTAGVFFCVKTPAGFDDPGQGPIESEGAKELCMEALDITATLESEAFYMGYHLALGLAHGNCRALFCSREKRCWAMVKGRVCLHPFKARPSIVAAGIDAASMARSLAWSNTGESSPVGGLVLVG